jgi:hypothetical protein
MTQSLITKRAVDAGPASRTTKNRITTAPQAPEIRREIDKSANSPVDERELASAREEILKQKYEIEELKIAFSDSHVERLKAELSASYATNREFKRELEEEREKNQRLNSQLNNAEEETENLCAEVKNARRENEKLVAKLKVATQENAKLIDLNRSQREQADQLAQILEAIAVWVEKGVCPLRSPALIDRDDYLEEVATDDQAA